MLQVGMGGLKVAGPSGLWRTRSSSGTASNPLCLPVLHAALQASRAELELLQQHIAEASAVSAASAAGLGSPAPATSGGGTPRMKLRAKRHPRVRYATPRRRLQPRPCTQPLPASLEHSSVCWLFLPGCLASREGFSLQQSAIPYTYRVAGGRCQTATLPRSQRPRRHRPSEQQQLQRRLASSTGSSPAPPPGWKRHPSPQRQAVMPASRWASRLPACACSWRQ